MQSAITSARGPSAVVSEGGTAKSGSATDPDLASSVGTLTIPEAVEGLDELIQLGLAEVDVQRVGRGAVI